VWLHLLQRETAWETAVYALGREGLRDQFCEKARGGGPATGMAFLNNRGGEGGGGFRRRVQHKGEHSEAPDWGEICVVSREGSRGGA